MTLTVWQRAQAWVGDDAYSELGNVDLRLLQLVGDGFSALHVKLHDGSRELNQGVVPFLRQRTAALGLHVVVGGWGFNGGLAEADLQGPKEDAEKANGLILRETCQYWVANVEDNYKAQTPGDANWQKNATFLTRFRQLLPTFPLGCCGEPNEADGNAFDWNAWTAAKARWLPECYAGQFPNDPAQWPGTPNNPGAVKVGAQVFPRAFVHPVLGMYGDVRAQAYIDSLRSAKADGFTYGYGVYLIHNLMPEDWAAFRAVNTLVGDARALAWHP